MQLAGDGASLRRRPLGPPPGEVRPRRRPGLGAPPLGATVHDGGTTFAVFSGGEAVDLCLYDDAGRETRLPLTDHIHGVWHGHVRGVVPGDRYGFRVHGPWDPWHGHRYNSAKLLVDPYARAVDGALAVDDAVRGHDMGYDDAVLDGRDSAPFVPRAVVVADDFEWGGDSPPLVPWTDTVLYELHVRGFTRRHPDVPPHLRGTYAGLAHPAVTEHLTSLGVTTVELLPVHHYESELALLGRGRRNYWGYNTLGFFAPHAGYSSSGSRGQQVHEFKAMVRALHDAGLEVVLDVVYNHTAEGGSDGPTLSLRGLDNRTYYRLRQGRFYEDFTGCGNTLDLRQSRTLALVTDSLRYWVEEMHVDGFRFDLAPALARGTDGFERGGTFLSVIAQDPVLSRVKLIAEPWDVGPGGYQLGHFPAPWAEWNDRFRDTVRQSWLGDNVRNQGSGMRDLAYRGTGSSDVFDSDHRGPLASINFITAHDGFTLHDLVTYERKRNEPNGEENADGSGHNRGWNCGVEGPTRDPDVLRLRRRMMRNLLATRITSTGVPMLTAGDETARTQLGNNNAYCLDDDTTWVDWSWLSAASRTTSYDAMRRDLVAWTRALISLRRTHAVVRRDHFFEGRPAGADGPKDLAWFSPNGREMTDSAWFDHDRRVLGGFVANADVDGESLLLLTNMASTETPFVLPDGPWASSYRVLLDTTDETPSPGDTFLAADDTVLLTPFSLAI
ncbi:MAG: glycogen debranching protein GlgX, partial [Actinomycetes bacterium]